MTSNSTITSLRPVSIVAVKATGKQEHVLEKRVKLLIQERELIQPLERASALGSALKPTTPRLDATTILNRIQEKLKTLSVDLDALKVFQDELEEATKRFPELESSLKGLKKAINRLLDPQLFMPDEVEGFVLPKAYDKSVTTSIASAGRLDMVKELRKLNLSSPKYGKTLTKQFDLIGARALMQRVESVMPEASHNVIQNEVQLICSMISMETKIDSFLDLVISSVHAKFDKTSAGKFSKLIKHFSHFNLNAIRHTYLKESREAYAAFIKKALHPKPMEILTTTPEQFLEALALIEAGYREECENDILDDITCCLEPWYKWLHENIPAIKKPYNQGDDASRNMGMGTCLQNSLDRIVLLTKTPALAAADIPMGSTERGRYLQAVVNQHGVKGSKLTEALEKLFSAPCKCRKIELMPPSDAPENSKSYIPEQLLALALSEKTPVLGYLSLFHATSGHAMTVQIDPSRGIYRLIDDNLGVLEYETAEKFTLEAGKYLTLTYSDYPYSALQTFVPIS